MIDVKELRIGNLALIKDGTNYDDHIWTISDVSEHGVGLKCVIGYASPQLEDVRPIRLTEDILLKCGFNQGKMQHGDLYFYWNNRAVAYGAFDDNLNEVLIDNVSIKFLHQLQNLYFALTGEELKISIKDL